MQKHAMKTRPAMRAHNSGMNGRANQTWPGLCGLVQVLFFVAAGGNAAKTSEKRKKKKVMSGKRNRVHGHSAISKSTKMAFA